MYECVIQQFEVKTQALKNTSVEYQVHVKCGHDGICFNNMCLEIMYHSPTRCSPTDFYALLLHLACVMYTGWGVCSIVRPSNSLVFEKLLFPLSKDSQLWYLEAVVFLINLVALWSMEISSRNLSFFHNTLRTFLQVSLKKEGNKIVISMSDIMQ